MEQCNANAEEAEITKETIRLIGLKASYWDVWLDGRYFLGRVMGDRDEAVRQALKWWPKFAGRMVLQEF